jgi:hypothetical protein
MAEKKTAAPVPQTGGGRSVNYPFITLEEAIKRARSLWNHVGKNLVPIHATGAFWGYAEKSSGLRSTVSALKQYGLVQDVGDGEDRQIRLTDRALDILIEPPDSPKRMNAIRQAALAPKIYAEILARFSEGIPAADSVISSYLLREKDFNRKTVDSFIADFRANFKLAKITSSANMPSKKDDEANGGSKVKVGDFVLWESGGVVQFAQPRQVLQVSEDGKFVFVEGSDTGLPIEGISVVDAPANASVNQKPPAIPQQGFKQDIYTLGNEGQVILQWPEKMSQESYDEFVDWIELQLRKIARLSGVTQKQK